MDISSHLAVFIIAARKLKLHMLAIQLDLSFFTRVIETARSYVGCFVTVNYLCLFSVSPTTIYTSFRNTNLWLSYRI
jgi:hypothetical protein